MPRELSTLATYSQYIAARMGVMALSAIDVETNLRAAAALGQLMYRIDKRHRVRAQTNLKLAFPDWDQATIDRTVKRSFEHFMQLVVEVCFSTRLIHPDSWTKRIVLDPSLRPTIEIFNAGKPAILVTGHIGNWEVLGNILATLGYRMDAIARPLDNKLINDWVLGLREKRGMRIITKWNATDRMTSVLENGGTLGFIADQNAGDKGLFVPFFGRLASTYKSVGLLAMTQNVPVICGYAFRRDDGYRYQFGVTDIIQPDEWQAQPDPLFYLTARYMRGLENAIRLCPHQYFWMHRRWKSRPPHERKGKPVPTSLRDKLAALPWMDDASVERACQPVEPLV